MTTQTVKTENRNPNKAGILAFLKQNHRAEWLAFGLFVVIYIVSAILHEPMYDEAQAWMIARDASWREILWEIPHYEGHPPFWHLFLAIFAKSGVSIDVGLRIVGGFFSISTVALLLFKSPFPKTIKCLLPFLSIQYCCQTLLYDHAWLLFGGDGI